MGIQQIYMSDTRIVMVQQRLPGLQIPGVPRLRGPVAGQQALVGQYDQAFDKAQLRVKVNLQRGQHVLLRA